ncbi:TPA: LysR family transcriptional regulator [Klebsiella michiganensis]|uniref:LysR family transcriptional regulator n=1 Tax=Enterobacter hormaechei TaxID=158836 RepID=UPI0039080241|nr:LysR family transcriptional regulator [Enterobacter hormaechei subsp. steigerwaltii]HAV1583968.1 LysR family transcriptional regulator [Enterobacter hormaechei subsp. steigerwaltii]HAV1867098.1 LysR family transcriptional regulator [Enterobacter hormaechei subsp. steigerwaltii]
MKARYLQDISLRYFLEVVRTGSISLAAQKLNVAASAISRQISGLESKLEATLFERSKEGMVPTAAGELLAAHAIRNYLETEKVLHELSELQGLRKGEVRIACSPGFSVDFLPMVIASFRRRFPEIHFQLTVTNAEEVIRRLREGESDLGLTFSQVPEANIHVAYRLHSRLMALMSSQHPLAGKSGLLLSQIAGYPLGLPERHIMMRKLFDACCSRQGLIIAPCFVTNSISALLAFARYEEGIIVSSELTVREYIKVHNMRAIPILGQDLNGLHIELNTLAGRTLPKAVGAFINHLISVMDDETSLWQ